MLNLNYCIMMIMEMKTVKSIIRFIFTATADIGSLLALLALLGIVQEPMFQGVDFFASYFILFVLVALLIFFLSSLLLGYQIHAWRKPKMNQITSANSLKEIPEFCSSRRELPPLVDFLKSAKYEVDLMGFSLWSISVQNRKTVEELLKQGKHVRFILLNPTSDL